MNQKEKIFTEGMIVKKNDNAPDFVIGNLSVKVDDFKKFLDKHAKNGWVNIDLKKSQGGKYYGEINSWEPKSNDVVSNVNPIPSGNGNDLPF